MAKTTQAHPSVSQDRQRKRDIENGIAILPDEILIMILSGMTIKEAGRTSMLSRRWRDLWRFTSGTLDFDYSKAKTYTWMERPTRFVTWVNQALKLHQGPSVYKLSICFGFPPDGFNRRLRIESLIRFAMQKRVRVLELKSIGGIKYPHLNLRREEDSLSISGTRAVIPKPSPSSHISSPKLKSLLLVNVNVEDSTLEHLLYIFPCLEHLSLRRSRCTRILRVHGPSSLKSLVIGYCKNLEELKISAVNLVYFEFRDSCFVGRSPPVLFENVPRLSELKIAGQYCESFLCVRDSQRCWDQLEKLVLIAPAAVVSSVWLLNPPVKLPRLQRLKQLELVLLAPAGETFLFFVLLTKACPFLCMIQVQFAYTTVDDEALTLLWLVEQKTFLAEANFRHESLKAVKLFGFGAYKGDMLFALSLLRITNSLENLTIKPRCKREREVRESATELEANLPQGAALVIV